MFLGDSITAAGQYVSLIECELQRRYPRETFDIISIGISSETTSALTEKTHGSFPRPCVHERLQRALDKVKPDIVVACYGMNDGIYHPQSDERMQAYQQGINKLIADSRAAGATVVLLTPPRCSRGLIRQGEGSAMRGELHDKKHDPAVAATLQGRHVIEIERK